MFKNFHVTLSIEGAMGLLIGILAWVADVNWEGRLVLALLACALAVHIGTKIHEKNYVKIIVSVVGIMLIAIATWHPIYEGIHKSIANDDGNSGPDKQSSHSKTVYQALSNSELKSQALSMARLLRVTEENNNKEKKELSDNQMDRPPRDNWPMDAKKQLFEKETKETMDLYVKQQNYAKETFFPKSKNLVEELRRRLGEHSPDSINDFVFFRFFKLAGISPLGDIADELQGLCDKLAD